MARPKIFTNEYLLDLAARLDNEKLEDNYDLGFYFNGAGYDHPLVEEVRCVLADSCDFECKRPLEFVKDAPLLDCNPALFSECDKDLAIRAIWKSGRNGFYHDGWELFPNGWVSTLLRHLNKLQRSDVTLPEYPEPRNFSYKKVPEYWKGINGLLLTSQAKC